MVATPVASTPGAPAKDADREFESLVNRLKQREHQLMLASAAIEHAGVGLAIFTDEGRIIHANEELSRALGYPSAQLEAMNVWEIIPDLAAEVFKEFWEAAPRDTELHYESIALAQGGTQIPFEVSVRKLDFEGEQIGVALALDITDRRRTEAALRESEMRFAHAFHGNPMIMSIVDDEGVYKEVNFSWELHTGYSAEETVGKHVSELPRWAEGDFDPTNELFTSPEMIDGIELHFYRKDGELRIGHVTVEPIEVTGRTCVLTCIEDVTERRRAEEESAAAMERLGALTSQTIATMARLVEARDPYTAGHEQRVTQLSVAIANKLELDGPVLSGINVAAQLHDIGKMIVPAEILAKPGKLSFAEFSLVKGHANAGFTMLSDIDFPWPVAEIVHQHHERLDGSGYPRGLKDGEILPEARIIAVADVVEAMSAHRPYRPSLGLDVALAEIERGRGWLYDSDAVDACVQLFREDGFAFE
jgi:PAS domain S-box-containing protein/putative nucleotidyltransferase with HDIG domain